MNTATVITMWMGDGDGVNGTTPYHPMLLDDYPGIAGYEDITGQPSSNLIPAPNNYTIRITVDDATLAAIQADSAYTVLTAEIIPVEVTP